MTERPAWPWWLKLFWTVFGGAVIALWGAALGIRLWPPEGRVHDFVQEWTSARAYWEGDPVYGDLRESIPKYLGRPYDDVIKVNAHPPPSIVLMLPFGKLGYRQAFALWNIISLSTLAITLWLLIRPQGLNYSPWVLLPWLALILTSNALAQQVNQGQFSLLLLLMLTVAWDCSRRDRWQAAGAILGLAAAIKLFPAYMGLYLLARRQYRAIVAMGLAFGGSVAISITMFGVDNWVYYLGDIVPSLSIFHDYWQNTSITAFWSKLFVGASGHVTPLVHNELVARVGVLTTCAVVTLWAGWATWRATDQRELDRCYGGIVIAMMCVSPITWDHSFVMLLLPAAILWRTDRGLLKTVTTIALLALITVYNKWIWDAMIPGNGELAQFSGLEPSVATPWQSATALSYQLYLLLLLFVVSVRPSWRREVAADSMPSLLRTNTAS